MGFQRGLLTGSVKCNLDSTDENEYENENGNVDGVELQSKQNQSSSSSISTTISTSQRKQSSFSPSSSSLFQPLLSELYGGKADYILSIDLIGDFTSPAIRLDRRTFTAVSTDKPTIIPVDQGVILKTQALLLFQKDKGK